MQVLPPPAAAVLTQVVEITAPGGPEVLMPRVRRVGPPGQGEVLVKVAAAGVNRHDCNQRRLGPGHEATPVPGLEVAGTVAAVGASVSPELLGAKVVTLTDGGGYADYAIAAAPLVLPWPEALDHVEAAALPEALFTAWFNFFHLLALTPGETAFVHGATSGVGSLAIPMLRALGYAVYGSAGSEAKRQATLGLGATAAFDYDDPDLARRVMDVVAHQSRALAVRGYGRRVRVGERYLPIRRNLDSVRHGLQLAHPRTQGIEPPSETRGAALGDLVLLAVGRIEGGEVACDARLDLLDAPLDRAWSEVPVTGVTGFEPAAFQRHDTAGEQAEMAAEHDELRAGGLDRGAIVSAEVGDGLEVRRETAGEPHQLNVPAGLTLQAVARGDLVEIAIEVELEQGGGMVARPARGRRYHAGKAKISEVDFIYKGIEDPHRIVRTHVIVDLVQQ